MDHAYRNDWRLDRLQPVLDALSSLNSGLSAAQYGDDLSTALQASFVAVRAACRGARSIARAVAIIAASTVRMREWSATSVESL